MSSLAETRRLQRSGVEWLYKKYHANTGGILGDCMRSGSDQDAERLDVLDDDDRGVDAASWLAASDAGQAKCCLAWLRVAGGGIDGMASDRVCV